MCKILLYIINCSVYLQSLSLIKKNKVGNAGVECWESTIFLYTWFCNILKTSYVACFILILLFGHNTTYIT